MDHNAIDHADDQSGRSDSERQRENGSEWESPILLEAADGETKVAVEAFEVILPMYVSALLFRLLKTALGRSASCGGPLLEWCPRQRNRRSVARHEIEAQHRVGARACGFGINAGSSSSLWSSLGGRQDQGDGISYPLLPVRSESLLASAVVGFREAALD
jgi:hypothetical protein